MREQRIFVWMGILTLGSALVGDLIFLPALLSHFPGRQTTAPSSPENESDHIGPSPAPEAAE
jgi:hypothetical protein